MARDLMQDSVSYSVRRRRSKAKPTAWSQEAGHTTRHTIRPSPAVR